MNLVACGLAIRARRAFSSLADETWQDALAVVSLIAPVLMLVIAALDFARAIREAMVEHHAFPAAGPFWSPWLVPFLGGPATVMIGWLAVVLLGLTGRRRQPRRSRSSRWRWRCLTCWPWSSRTVPGRAGFACS